MNINKKYWFDVDGELYITKLKITPKYMHTNYKSHEKVIKNYIASKQDKIQDIIQKSNKEIEILNKKIKILNKQIKRAKKLLF